MNDSAPLKTAVSRGKEIADKMSRGRPEEASSNDQPVIASKLRHGGEILQHGISQGAEDFPVVMALGFLAFGFLIGLAVPHSKKEDRMMGTLADQVKKKGIETGKEVMAASESAARRAIQPLKKTSGDDLDSGISS